MVGLDKLNTEVHNSNLHKAPVLFVRKNLYENTIIGKKTIFNVIAY